MPFRKYLGQDEGNGHSDSYQAYGDQARTNMLGIGSSNLSNSVQFQIPQFMLNGPPTLALGGGAEVLPAGMFNNQGSSWFNNNGFNTKSFEDK